jgi:N-acetylated-alpha-linked acidic dipeptidase
MKIHIAVLLSATGIALAQSPIRGFAPDQVKAEQALEAKATAMPEAARVRTYEKRMSARPHHAGSAGNRAVANYILAELKEWNLPAHVEVFEPLLPYPTVRSLELVGPVHYVAKLKEPVVPQDPDSGDAGQLPTYNAYSASGNVTGQLVYVNYGRPEDYGFLDKHGIDVKGRIVIARYGKCWRGTKVKVAQEHGAIGCLIYSDPRDDGYFQGDIYPKGPYRPWQGVQRGSVVDMPLYPGDPLTPGWAAVKGAKRLPIAEAKSIMKIPVLPISYGDAEPLLAHMAGPVVPEEWRGALPITYHAGPGPSTVHLKVDFDWTEKPIQDLIAVIPGSEFKDQWVMYGNHYDAWVNGAADPLSGTSSLLETARTLAAMYRQGWRPKRTIVLSFWDGEEFGLMGSTEWAEKHEAELEKKAAVYINSDTNGKGTLGTSGSHELETFMAQIMRDVMDPVTGKSLLEMRVEHGERRGMPPGEADGNIRMGSLGAGSDYVAFIDHIGISSLNLGFGGEGGGGVYHSVYDSYYWFTHFSDTDFQYGKTLSEVTTLALMRLADAPVLPYEFSGLTRSVRGYVDEIQKLAEAKSHKVDFDGVNAQLSRMESAVHAYEDALEGAAGGLSNAPAEKLAEIDGTLFRTERALTLSDGLPGHDWYRHELYAPGLYTGYGVKTLPGVREAVEAGKWPEADQQASDVAHALSAVNDDIEHATKLLQAL